jgi:hypothetical protein
LRPDRLALSRPNKVVITMSEPKKPSNLKTGLIIGGIALFFFVMVFVKRLWL